MIEKIPSLGSRLGSIIAFQELVNYLKTRTSSRGQRERLVRFTTVKTALLFSAHKWNIYSLFMILMSKCYLSHSNNCNNHIFCIYNIDLKLAYSKACFVFMSIGGAVFVSLFPPALILEWFFQSADNPAWKKQGKRTPPCSDSRCSTV